MEGPVKNRKAIGTNSVWIFSSRVFRNVVKRKRCGSAIEIFSNGRIHLQNKKSEGCVYKVFKSGCVRPSSQHPVNTTFFL